VNAAAYALSPGAGRRCVSGARTGVRDRPVFEVADDELEPGWRYSESTSCIRAGRQTLHHAGDSLTQGPQPPDTARRAFYSAVISPAAPDRTPPPNQVIKAKVRHWEERHARERRRVIPVDVALPSARYRG